MLDVLKRNNVKTSGAGGRAMLFAHGYGCDQNMWRFVAPNFEATHRTITFDHVGAGGSDLAAFDRARYATLDAYADDMIEIMDTLDARDAIFVGHSVGAMIGVLAAKKRPGLFGKLVLVGPSPRYIDDEHYRGGFTASQIDELLTFLDTNHMGWSHAMAPVIMGNADRPELAEELDNSFCRTDPEIAKHFARVTFTSDNRADLAAIDVPVLILQCTDDVIAPEEVGEYVRANMRRATLVKLAATGHCPNLSAPEETSDAIAAFV
jgi:sigma-B regulation protein RsbQ